MTRVLEAVAAAMGLGIGAERLVLEFRDGHLRRWSRDDLGNGSRELARHDNELALNLGRALGLN